MNICIIHTIHFFLIYMYIHTIHVFVYLYKLPNGTLNWFSIFPKRVEVWLPWNWVILSWKFWSCWVENKYLFKHELLRLDLMLTCICMYTQSITKQSMKVAINKNKISATIWNMFYIATNYENERPILLIFASFRVMGNNNGDIAWNRARNSSGRNDGKWRKRNIINC